MSDIIQDCILSLSELLRKSKKMMEPHGIRKKKSKKEKILKFFFLEPINSDGKVIIKLEYKKVFELTIWFTISYKKLSYEV